MDELITDDEIKKVRKSAIITDFHKILTGKEIPVPERITLESGYTIGMSIDEYPTGGTVEHLSVSRLGRKPDAADSEIIAKAVLGDGYRYIGSFYYENVEHYMKPLDGFASRLIEMIIKNKKEFL